MEKIGGAIIGKVKAEAQNIIRDAEEKAREEMGKAKKQREERFEEEKRRMIKEAGEEVARILALASVKARQETLSVKANIIADIFDKVRKNLYQTPTDKNLFSRLINEAVSELGGDKARIYVCHKDVGDVKNFLDGDEELASKITEIKEGDFWGGVVAEDIDGKLRIDNTYETRLEMLLPKLLPEISGKLFEEP